MKHILTVMAIPGVKAGVAVLLYAVFKNRGRFNLDVFRKVKWWDYTAGYLSGMLAGILLYIRFVA